MSFWRILERAFPVLIESITIGVIFSQLTGMNPMVKKLTDLWINNPNCSKYPMKNLIFPSVSEQIHSQCWNPRHIAPGAAAHWAKASGLQAPARSNHASSRSARSRGKGCNSSATAGWQNRAERNSCRREVSCVSGIKLSCPAANIQNIHGKLAAFHWSGRKLHRKSVKIIEMQKTLDGKIDTYHTRMILYLGNCFFLYFSQPLSLHIQLHLRKELVHVLFFQPWDPHGPAILGGRSTSNIPPWHHDPAWSLTFEDPSVVVWSYYVPFSVLFSGACNIPSGKLT